MNPNSVKIVNNCKKKFTENFTRSSKFIIFNKSIMAKHPDIELDTASVFKSLIQMIRVLDTEEACREHLERLRWDGEPICPHCGSQRTNHYRLKAKGEFKGLYKCKDCRSRFTVTVGTMFEGSHIPLTKWFMAIFVFSSHKKGISSVQLAKDIDVTQKSAWFMLSRIRHSFQNDVDFQFDAPVQVDETFVGGKNKNRSKGKKKKKTQGRSLEAKTPVFGMISEGLVYTQVVTNTRGETLKSIIKAKVKIGTVVVSDGWQGYKGLSYHYQHKIIEHNKGIYKVGQYHTNSIEGFWSQLKRGLIGIYHQVSPKHLHRYCDEFAYRYNTRHMSEGERFNLSLINADRKLMYRELIAD
jgi:transposase-like protein